MSIPNTLVNNTVADATDLNENFTALDTLITELQTGWISAGETWTYASADDPTYTFTISGDLTTKYYAGMRISLTQTTEKFFIITKVAYGAPNTTITIYGGTDYDLANAAITSPYYSRLKAPARFPLDPTKWTVRVSDTTQRSGAGTGGTYLNVGTTNSQIIIPIGAWNIDYQVEAWGDRTSAGTGDSIYVTLSTTNNSVTDSELTSRLLISGSAANQSDVMAVIATRFKHLILASKTTYYLNMKMDSSGTWYFENSSAASLIRAVCAYL